MDKPKKSAKKVVISTMLVLVAVVLLGFVGFTLYCMVVSKAALHSVSEYQNEFPDVTISVSDDDWVEITSKAQNNESLTGIIFYVGAQIEPDAYIPFMAQLAERGYYCCIPRIPHNLGPMSPNIAQDVITNNPSVKSWYVAGHSMGGFTASGFAIKNADNIDGLILIGAYTNHRFNDFDIPMLSIYGDLDGVMNKGLYKERLSWNSRNFEEHIIKGGNHAQFGDYGSQMKDGIAAMSAEEQQEQAAIIIDEWIRFQTDN